MSFTLIGRFEGQEIRHVLAEGTVVVGRGVEAGIRLPVASVSRKHAALTVAAGRLTVEDLGSRNGTRVNGRPVVAAELLRPGDRLDVAGIILRVEGEQPVAMTTYNELSTLIPHEEISWADLSAERQAKSDSHTRLFQILAEAGELMTVPRAPEALYEPILDLVETALDPERCFILMIAAEGDDPAVVASRVHGARSGDALALSRTLVGRVLNQRTSILINDPLNDPSLDAAMSMVSHSIRSAVAAPLFDNENVIGLLYADDTRPRRITRDELRTFTMLANHIAVALSHSRYHHLEVEKQRQDAELATASEILARILPTELPSLPGWDLHATLEPCFEVGGDLYDARALPDGRLAVVVGDVTGKGLGAALLVSQVLSLTRFMLGEGWPPAPLMTRLNREIFLTTDFVRFATVFLGILDPTTGGIACVNAGHNPPVVVRADGRVETCSVGSTPVGMMEAAEYPVAEVTLAPGDMLAMFSDGIPEAVDTEDEEYGDARLARQLAEHRAESLPDAAAAVLADLASFRAGADVGDDVTLMLLRRRPA